MSRAAHKKMIAEMKEALEETIREMINSGDYPSIIDIKANKSYTEFLMVVDQENYENSFDELSVLILEWGACFTRFLTAPMQKQQMLQCILRMPIPGRYLIRLSCLMIGIKQCGPVFPGVKSICRTFSRSEVCPAVKE